MLLQVSFKHRFDFSEFLNDATPINPISIYFQLYPPKPSHSSPPHPPNPLLPPNAPLYPKPQLDSPSHSLPSPPPASSPPPTLTPPLTPSHPASPLPPPSQWPPHYTSASAVSTSSTTAPSYCNNHDSGGSSKAWLEWSWARDAWTMRYCRHYFVCSWSTPGCLICSALRRLRQPRWQRC